MASIGQKLKLDERIEAANGAPRNDSGEDKGFLTRVLSSLKGDSIWAFADQGIASLGNFLTAIIAARMLIPREYGIFAILLGGVLFAYGVHSALVTYPLSLRGAVATKESLRSLAGFSLLLAISLGILLGICLVGVSLAFGRFSSGLCASFAMILLIAQETLRRALMAHMRFRGALIGDLLSYFGQAAVVLVLGLAGWLSVETAFLAMGTTSLMAAGLQAAQLGIWPLRFERASALIVDYWNLARWALLNNVTGVFSLQMFPWLLSLARDASAAASLQALVNVLGVTNPIVFSTVSLIVPAGARAWRDRGIEGVSKIANRYALRGGLFLLPLFAGIFFAPTKILTMFYGQNSLYASLRPELQVLSVAHLTNYAAVVMAAVFSAVEDARATFWVLLASAFGSMLLGVPLVLWKGIWGASVAMCGSALIRVLISKSILARKCGKS